MQVINLDAIKLAAPASFQETAMMTFHAMFRLHAGDILFRTFDDRTDIYRILVSKSSGVFKGFLSRVIVRKVAPDEHNYPEFHEKVCDALGVPF